jgi:hypothetical protein
VKAAGRKLRAMTSPLITPHLALAIDAERVRKAAGPRRVKR